MAYFETQTTQDKLFDKTVSQFLAQYILRYKKYLFQGFALVILITGVSLTTPYISKIIIDRHVIKSGYIVYKNRLDETYLAAPTKKDAFIKKKLGENMPLDSNRQFLFKSDTRFFSQQQIKAFIDKKILSSEIYVLFENGSNSSPQFTQMIDSFQAKGVIEKVTSSLCIMQHDAADNLSISQSLTLRQFDLLSINKLVLVIVILFFLQFFATYYQNLTLMKLSQYSMRDLRVELFNRLLHYELRYFDSQQIGKLVNRITNDIEVLNEMFSSVMVSLFQDLILLAGITFVMFRENTYLALCVAITFPFILFLTILFRVKSTQAYRTIREITAQLNAFLSETISGIRIIQIFVSEIKNFTRFKSINTSLYKANVKQLSIFAVFRPSIDFFKWFAIASLLYFGSQGIVNHTISYGLIVLFLQYIALFFEPLTDLSDKFDTLISANAAGEKILTVINAQVRIENDNEKKDQCFGMSKAMQKSTPPTSLNCINSSAIQSESKEINGAIAFKNVWFSYTPSAWVLKDITFSVKPKQTIAIVGETGSGKSTIISLLSRFYEIQKGMILIDDKPLNSIPYSLLRAHIACVMQDVFLFSKTIRDNIILNAPFDQKRFDMVCKITHIDSFINTLPQKDQEPVMERAVTFSAGQRQLISFARALYFDPAILILDEATSTIDSETEKLIQDAIQHLIQNRTSILIAHRLSTICQADTILVLEKGNIAESGTHKELLQKKGIYFNLYNLQFQST